MELSFRYSKGQKNLYTAFLFSTFLGGILKFGLVLDFSDLLILGMSLTNLIGVYILRKRVLDETRSYIGKLKNGAFKS